MQVIFLPSGRSRRALAKAGLLALTLLLGACAGRVEQPPLPEQRPAPAGPAPVTRPPIQREPIQASPTSLPASTQRTHPRYAPPPGAPAHWDNRLGVYVLEGTPLYYRERLYYRWDGDWYCAGRPDGPWEAVALPSVPLGLRSRQQ